MALQVVGQTSSNSSNKIITFTEITGNYSVSNPNGYGTTQLPTGFREIADLTSATLAILSYDGTYSFLGSSTPEVGNLLYSTTFDSTTAQSIANGTSQLLDLDSLIGADYIDGVYKLIYYNWFPADSNVVLTFVDGSSTVNFTAGNADTFSTAKYLQVDVNTIYEILSVNSTTNTLVINEVAATSGTNTTYSLGYYTENIFSNVFDINTCLFTNIAKSACSDCGCNPAKKKKLFQAVMQFFGIDTNMAKGNYKCVQDIINAITIFCSNDCNC